MASSAALTARARYDPSKRMTYIFPGYFPRKVVSMVAGKRGEGKSLFVAWLAGQVSTGYRVTETGARSSSPPPTSSGS
jgi:hypothetical protein